ncbi:MAG: glutamate 5-kinase [Desulfobacteraceae bacterium]|jgi:glutamate 5-kinase|nr:MAG: glutamate 5-kinase [Desulfobacteraceae bacterium]
MCRANFFHNARRIVVKVGSGVLTAHSGLNLAVIETLSRQINQLTAEGREVLLVSSGAMAAGMKKIGLTRRPDEIPKRQAIAAVGQSGLMMAYEQAFVQYDRKVAQVLLTGEDLNNRIRYLNARNTLHTLLAWKIIPVINENDTVAVAEIKFGDNDHLSAMIALLMDADILINLTDIGGLYTADPGKDPAARLIPEVLRITKAIEKLAGGIPGVLGTGGMLTKIKAARKVTGAGIPMVIGPGLEDDVLLKLFSGKSVGTFFAPAEIRLSRRKCWIGYTLKPKGTIVIDDGAADAILEKGKSLLPGGITDVSGDFGEGAPVELRDGRDVSLAMGLVNYSAADIRRIMGCNTSAIRDRLGHKSYDEVIHRNNLTVFNDCR